MSCPFGAPALKPLRSSRRARLARALAGAAASWLLVATGIGVLAAAPATHTVVIDGVKYEPESITVKRGETVVWINKDPFPHTVTVKGAFDSHEIAAGKSWRYTPNKAGEYAYVCTLHPTMKGVLRVE